MNKLLILISVFFLIGSAGFALETVKGAQKDIQNFKQTMSSKLHEIDKKIDSLRGEAERKKDESVRKNVEDYERKRLELSEEVDQLQADAKGSWKETKKRIATSIDDLNAKIQRALKE